MIRVFFILSLSVIQAAGAYLAIRQRTDVYTDISYSGTFLVLITGMYFWYSTQLTVHTILFLLISMWSIRLGLFLFFRILALGKDKRFDGIREKKQAFVSFRLFQAVVIFLLLLPSVVVMQQKDLALTGWNILGAIIALGGIVLETVADWQKFRFKQQYPTRWCAVGVRSYIQYPHYLGEILMWLGAYVVCLSGLSGFGTVLGLISPCTIFWLLVFVTGIPPLEAVHKKQWGSEKEWCDYHAKTPKLLPYIY